MTGTLEKANDCMKRLLLFSIAVLSISGASVSAQNNPPQFDTLITVDTVLENVLLNWNLPISDPDPGDSLVVGIDPPPADPLYQGATQGPQYDPTDSLWYFQFRATYTFVDAGEADVRCSLFVTDNIDTVYMPVTITVVHFNPAPAFNQQPGNYAIADGIGISIPVSADDPDLSTPILSAEPIAPALPNAAFIDNGDGTGQFDFTPDATQTEQDYTITFVASDGEKADTVFSVISVVTYQPAVVNPIDPKSVAEGELLEFLIIGSNPITISAPLELSAVDHPDLKFIVVDSSDTSALFRLFEDSNYVKLDTDYDLVYYAYNGRDTTFDTTVITITDSLNFPPVFETVNPYTILEGIEEIHDTLVARDPEGNPVSITLLSSDTVGIENLALDPIGPDSALLSFAPDYTQGGSYVFRVLANDFLSGEEDNAVDTVDILITVNEVDFPPTLEIDTIGFFPSLREGDFVRFEITAFDMFDSITPIPIDFTIFPPADSAVFKGNAVFVDEGDAGFFEFYPGYNQVTVGSDTTFQIIISASDSMETVEVKLPITVYDVKKGVNDPFDADTLTLVNSLWDTVIVTDTIPLDTLGNDSIVVDTTLGFTLTSRIWNDSNLTAAMTGFRWFEPWLKCDTVRFGPRLTTDPDAADFRRIYIYNDLLAFQATFLYMGGKSLPPDPGGGWVHLTADFHIDRAKFMEVYELDTLDINQLLQFMPAIFLDTASVGSASRFVFDKQPKLASSEEAIEQYLRLLKTSDLTYPPLVNRGWIRQPGNEVKLQIFDVSEGYALGNGSSLYLYDDDDSVHHYELRVSVENRHRLSELSLGLRVSSDDSAIWYYGDTTAIVVASSRMAPEADVWNVSNGLDFSGSSIDGTGADTLTFVGTADATPGVGLPPGLLEHMIRVPFTVDGVVRDEVKQICFETASVNGGPDARFVESTGAILEPPFSGNICFPVRTRRVLKAEADSIAMTIYDVRADTMLSPGDVLYMMDENDSTNQYELRLSLENLRRLKGLSLGLRIYSEDGAQWAYSDTVKPVVIAGSRMSPDSTVWNQSQGLIYADASMQNADGTLEDTLELVGASSEFTQFGLMPGFMEPMVAIPFTITGVGEGDEKTLCFDTTATDSGNAWRYVRITVDTLSQDSVVQDTTIIDTVNPGFSGAICMAVRYKKVTGTDDEIAQAPVLYSLEQNYPNPFNPATTIRFRIGKREHVRIIVYNILGQTVTTLADGVYPPGDHEVTWDGRDRGGRPVASGIYLYHIDSEGIRQTRKMILLK